MAEEPSVGIDYDGLQDQLNMLNTYIEQNKTEKAAEEAVQTERQEETTQAEAVQDDPRNAEKWGLKAVAKEFQSIGAGGIQDTASSIATFPERTVDAFSGEMARERKEKGFYRPEFHPFTDYENPIVTKTWWGKLLRGTVHFGTMAAAIIPAAKVTAARTGLSIAALGGKTMASSLLRASAVGAASDLVSKESDGHNALGALKKHYSWIDTPITTRDTDSPIWMKFKNIVEGMGIGLVFDSASVLLGKGSKRVLDKVKSRNDTAKDQTIEAGLAQVRRGETEFRAEKNAPLAQAHQGAHITQEPVEEVIDKYARTKNNWLEDDGAAGSVTTPVQRDRIVKESGASEEVVEDVLKKLWTTEKFQAKLEEVKAGRQTLAEAFGDAVLAHQRITNGRNAAEMSTEDYLQEVFTWQKDMVNDEKILTTSKLVAVDLITGTLIQQLRDTGIAARELTSLVDITDADGPAKQISDTLIAALTLDSFNTLVAIA